MNYQAIVAELQRQIIGQDEAIAALSSALMFAQAGINDPDKPLAVLMFLGPTGVGKTEMVRVLASAIHGDTDTGLCRIDMATLAEHHYAASLAGSPPGYVGSQEGAGLLDKERIEGRFQRPGILLLDEIEKAHPTVRQTLLEIFDNARIKLSSGAKEIDFRNTIIVMTSNVGSDALREVASLRRLPPGGRGKVANEAPSAASVDWEAHRQRVAATALESMFSPEFLNRIDATVVFRWLDRDDLLRIVDLQVARLNSLLSGRTGVRLELTDNARAFLVDQGFDLTYGARHLRRAIRRCLQEPLARLLLEKAAFAAGVVEVSVSCERLVLTLRPPAAAIQSPNLGSQVFQIPHPASGRPLYPYPAVPGGRGAVVRLPGSPKLSWSRVVPRDGSGSI